MEERLKESITLLNKIQELGIGKTDPGYKELSAKFSEWVKGGDVWQGNIDFIRWNRRARILLPVRPGSLAKVDLLHYVF